MEWLRPTVTGEGSKVILRHTAAGYSCGYGFSYQLWGGAGLEVRVGGEGGEGGVVWKDRGDTGNEWKQVNMHTLYLYDALQHMYIIMIVSLRAT